MKKVFREFLEWMNTKFQRPWSIVMIFFFGLNSYHVKMPPKI